MERKPTIDEVRAQIERGIEAMEGGDYTVGQKELRQAFDKAAGMKNRELAIEAGNQYAIQCRLIAGRASRKGDRSTSEAFSKRSLEVFGRFKDLGYFDLNNPGNARGWSHALLYAGRIDEAISELERSAKIQENPAAKGDEMCHSASAHLYKGKIEEAKRLVDEGISLIKENDGSPIGLTYGLMTKASILVQEGDEDKTRATLKEALQIAEDESLAVRKEEIEYLLSKKGTDINVLAAVANVS